MKRLLTILTLVAAAACGDSTNGVDGFAANVQVSFATQRPAAPASLARAASFAGDTLVQGSDTLILSSVEVVLKEIELKRLEVADCDDSTNTGDACEKFAAGPVLVSLPLGPGAEQRFALVIPAGTYTEVEFDIHKPDDGDPVDQAFVAANPAFADISIRVQGTFNDTAFVYTSDLNVEQELALIPSLVITDASSATNLTILVEVDRWFRNAAGSLIDPATANKGGDNEGVVKENIKNSVEAFEDEDRDGDDD
jgi:hypothetical protein